MDRGEFLASQGKTSERQSIGSVFVLKNMKGDGEKGCSLLRTVVCFKNKDVLMQIGTPLNGLVGFTCLPFTSVGYWISSKEHSHIRYIYVYLCTSTPPVCVETPPRYADLP